MESNKFKVPFGYNTNTGLPELEIIEHNKVEQTAIVRDTLTNDSICLNLEEVEYLYKILKSGE